jgi:hypothetical protein
MKKQIETLKDLLARYDEFETERRKLDVVERESKETIRRIHADGNIDPSEEKDYGRSVFTLSMLPTRRKKLEEAIAPMAEELFDAMESLAEGMSRQLVARHDQEKARMIAALLPFYEGNAEVIERTTEWGMIPLLQSIGRARWNPEYSLKKSIVDCAVNARNLLKRVDELTARGWLK